MYILLVMAPVAALCIIRTNSGVIPVAVRGQGGLTLAGTGRVGVRTAASGGCRCRCACARARWQLQVGRENPDIRQAKSRGCPAGSGLGWPSLCNHLQPPVRARGAARMAAAVIAPVSLAALCGAVKVLGPPTQI